MVQVRLDFKTEKPELPRDLDKLIVSFLKASLQNFSTELYEQLYGERKAVLKTFTYSLYLPGAKFLADKIVLKGNNFSLYFSDSDIGQLIQFINAFKLMRFKKYSMNRNSMELQKVYAEKKEEITDSEIIVKIQSSLVVRKHEAQDNSDVYYIYNHPDFCKTLKKNVEIFLEKLEIPLSTEGFSIVPIKGKKIVTDIFGRKTDANIGIYKLTGSPQLLNLLYQSGMGSRRSEGHGKFEVIW
ncbi:CRISPR-associated endoribonuclease Cas6 [Mediterraneibacter sp. NSJ-55]|uniref:CRISPR-associated endoribonuclease Cas6 n=1 Tax=Mediterraneibacter hominis TaxID=2763054 RepID=A0A923RQZ6_9FIRM|nr:CRISPR-associated endoribonuclease Cas6 [Mediterraneibacter hominis]MBC5690046.1 CRISPR-associated endoribonuclease Cas6 [Mediterraneibacter hominis]